MVDASRLRQRMLPRQGEAEPRPPRSRLCALVRNQPVDGGGHPENPCSACPWPYPRRRGARLSRVSALGSCTGCAGRPLLFLRRLWFLAGTGKTMWVRRYWRIVASLRVGLLEFGSPGLGTPSEVGRTGLSGRVLSRRKKLGGRCQKIGEILKAASSSTNAGSWMDLIFSLPTIPGGTDYLQHSPPTKACHPPGGLPRSRCWGLGWCPAASHCGCAARSP